MHATTQVLFGYFQLGVKESSCSCGWENENLGCKHTFKVFKQNFHWWDIKSKGIKDVFELLFFNRFVTLSLF